MKLAIETDYRVTEAVLGIHRVEVEAPDKPEATHKPEAAHKRYETIGYVLEAGHVFVSLRGAVYNTSVEIGQSLDLDAAVKQLLH